MCKEKLMFDGGLGHELKLRLDGTSFLSGAKACVDSAEKVIAVHESFYRSAESAGWNGQTVATTNSFVATPYHWRHEEDCDAWIMHVSAAADCAREAASNGKKNRLVAGCLPPLGECYTIPEATKEELIETYKKIIDALGEVDLYLAETLSSSLEAEAALIAVASYLASPRSTAKKRPLFACSFTLADDTSCRLRGGELLEDAADRIMRFGLVAFLGVNCCSLQATEVAIDLLSELIYSQAPTCRILVYANAFAQSTSSWLDSIGRPDARTQAARLADIARYSSTSTVISPQVFAQSILDWAHRGVSAFGGCCGATPAHMHAIAKALVSLKSSISRAAQHRLVSDLWQLLYPNSQTGFRPWRISAKRVWRPRKYAVDFVDKPTFESALKVMIFSIDSEFDQSLLTRIYDHLLLRFHTEGAAANRGASTSSAPSFNATSLDLFASNQINTLALSFTKRIVLKDEDDCREDDDFSCQPSSSSSSPPDPQRPTNRIIRLPTTALVLVHAYIHNDLTHFAGRLFQYTWPADANVDNIISHNGFGGVGIMTKNGLAVCIEYLLP